MTSKILLSESDEDLQVMLDFVHEWCNKWRLRIDNTKQRIKCLDQGHKAVPPPFQTSGSL